MAERIRRLFLCRHGETYNNQRKICCGKIESQLNRKGKEQARLLGLALKKRYSFQGEKIIFSTLGRTRETASIAAAQLGKSPDRFLFFAFDALREMNLGNWEGLSFDEIEKHFPEHLAKWRDGNTGPNFRFPGGESIREIQQRVRKCFSIIKKVWLKLTEEKDNDLLIVAHGGTNTTILTDIISPGWETYNYRSIKQENCCINLIHFRQNGLWKLGPEIVLINGTDHLSSLCFN